MNPEQHPGQPASPERAHKYEMLVSASTHDEAIAIVAEGLPKGAEMTTAHAEDCSASHGSDTWRVSITYRGGQTASSDFLS